MGGGIPMAERGALGMAGGKIGRAGPKPPEPISMDVYHGTTKNIDQLIPSKGGEFGPGVYLADTPEMASYFGGRNGSEGLNIIRATVDLKNPFTVTKQDWIEMTKNKTPMQVQNKLKKQGYDGIIGVGSNGIDKQIVPFDVGSIKPKYTTE